MTDRPRFVIIDAAVREVGRLGVEAVAVEPVGATADSIVDVARERQADLVVVGSRHRGKRGPFAFRRRKAP